MGMVMDMDTGVVAGGVHPFIIPPAGVDGMEVQDHMASMEIISMCTIIFMLITRTMYIETELAYQARVIIVPEELLPER